MAKAANVFVENPIHESLKGGDGVTETLGHDNPFKQTERSFEICLVNIRFFHKALIVCHGKIHFGKDFATSSSTNDVVLTRERSMVLDGIVIESAIIMDDTRGSVKILLGDEESTGGVRTLRRTNSPSNEHFFKEIDKSIEAIVSDPIVAPIDVFVRVLEAN